MTEQKASFFENCTRTELLKEVASLYQENALPWVVGFSGGKDSTLALQIVWEALRELPTDRRKKQVFVVACDTLVESPMVAKRLRRSVSKINSNAREDGLPINAFIVTPTLNDSFWVNLIGRGYPAPTIRFRWCTERMKIRPTNHFVSQKVNQYGEVVVVLGLREAESATRAQLMNSYLVKGTSLRRHGSLPGAYVYAPLAKFNQEDVWSYLLQVPNPWGDDNGDLAALYKDASAGECPLVIDLSTSSCGNTRFGCWVCTVAQRDSSMEALVDSGEEWLESLLEFRDLLATTGEPEKKRLFRDIKGRDGRVIFKKDGTLAARSFKLSVSRLLLEKLLQAQVELEKKGSDFKLITYGELKQIRNIWRLERQDWDDSVPALVKKVLGTPMDWPIDDDVHFDSSQMALLAGVCAEYEVPTQLVAKLLQVEKIYCGRARRQGISKAIGSVLREEWRQEDQILDQAVHYEKLNQ